MARVTATPTAVPARYSSTSAPIAWTPGDTSNNHQFRLTGNQILLARNVHASSARTITITSTTDRQGRTGNITARSLAAGEVHVFEPFDMNGWMQTDGMVYYSVSGVELETAVLTLP